MYQAKASYDECKIFDLVIRPGRRPQPSLKMSSFCLFVCLFVLVCRFRHSETQTEYSPYTSLFCVTKNGRHSASFLFVRIRDIKPWNHLHICTVVLWTKIVVDFMSP